MSNNFCKDGSFYIHGNFDETVSREIIPHLVQQIEEKSKIKDSKIKFFINSSGGYAHILKDLLSLIDIAHSHGIIVETYVFGDAHSCGSMLACSGTKGHRFVSEYATHLCHLGSTAIRTETEEQLKRGTKYIKEHFNFVRSIYKKNANIKNLDAVLNDDMYYIHGKDIIKNGLADKII